MIPLSVLLSRQTGHAQCFGLLDYYKALGRYSKLQFVGHSNSTRLVQCL